MIYKDFILRSLAEASEIARQNFGKVSGTIKNNDDNQVVTEIDLKIGSMLIDYVQDSFPDHNIIDEEAGVIDKDSNFTWVIDPIDGTSNYANRVPLYGIMLGLLKDDVPVAGGLALPGFSEIYVAEKGKGTYCNSEKIHLTKEVNFKSALVAYGIDGNRDAPEFTYDECRLMAEIILNVGNVRISNSVFDSVMVLKGGYAAFLNRSAKIWDNVAQQVIIEEAGGIFTDFFGHPMDYSNALHRSDDNFTFFAASPIVHFQLLNIIQRRYSKLL